MAEAIDQELVASVARDAVARVAPEELMLFPATSDAYFKNPSSVTRKGGQDDLLGFGGGPDVTFLTPVILSMATEVVRFVVAEASKAAGKEAAAAIVAYARAALGHPKTASQQHALRLSEAQLERVHQLAVQRALQLDIPSDKAEFLADAVVGTLVTA